MKTVRNNKMKQTMEKNNYELLPSEEIPDCCGSCFYSEMIHKISHFTLTCCVDDTKICVFGRCGKFTRRDTLK